MFLAALACYFLVHLLTRVFLSGSLERDEAEIVYLTQHLQLGYGAQPSLYAWLQWLFFQVFGLNRFALAILKDLLLFATYAGLFSLARPLIGARTAVVASLSLALFPQIGWESLRDLTHSVLLTTLACMTLWCYFAALRRPDSLRYASFGLCAGLGMLAKYNFAVFIAGLACASLLVREHRRILWNPKGGIAILAAFLVLLPHGLWLLDHLPAATSGTLAKLAEDTQEGGYAANVLSGSGSLLLAAVAFMALFALFYALVCLPFRERSPLDLKLPRSRFFLCLYGVFMILLFCIVLSGDVGKIKDRWMLPLLFSLPLAFFTLWPGLARETVVRRIARVSATAACLFLLLMPMRVYLEPALGKAGPPNHPYPELADELTSRFPPARTVVADGTLIAGNLRFENPSLRALLLKDASGSHAAENALRGKLLIVMHGNAAPDGLSRFRQAHPGAKILDQGKIDLNHRFGGKKAMSFQFAYIDAG